MSACCDTVSVRKSPAWVRRVREIFAWVLPGTILVLVPKCPACLAAHVTLWTGLGLSLSTATYVRWVLLFLCVASLLFLIVERLDRVGAISKRLCTILGGRATASRGAIRLRRSLALTESRKAI